MASTTDKATNAYIRDQKAFLAITTPKLNFFTEVRFQVHS